MSSSSSLHHWTRVIERELNQKQGHAEKLLAIHNRCCQPKRDDDQLSIVSSEVIVITGPTGVGKTTLALTFEDMAARHDNSFFCRGAFRPLTASSALPNNENLQQRQNADAINYEPFVAAMTELVDLLIRSRRRDSIQAFQTILLQDMDSSELELLEANIPVLRKITSTSNISRSSNATRTKKKWIGLKGIDAEKRNMRTFCKLIIAVCSLDHPLILLLEDLQAADQHSLDFIKMVLTNVKSGLTLIGTVRLDNVNDEEFGEGNNNILSTFLSDLKNSDSVTLTEIQLSPLLLNEVIEILSGLLHSSLEKVEPLATMVYHQTNGNMFDIVQLMKEFEGEGILYLDSQGTENWRWDEAQMVLSGWCNRPVQDLLTCRIKKLEEFDQRLLKSASCLGNVIHETLLSEIVFPSASVRPALERAKDDGLITFDTGMGSGRFLHHRIQDAFYSLIPQADRAKMHLDIGLRLWIWLPPNEMETHLFTVVSQILRGLHLLDDPVEKEDLAKLMLRAGQKAVQQSTFSNAASYFEIGVSLLQRNHWKHQYDISLALYNAAVEAQYYNGNIQQMDLLLAGIFKHGKSLDDMLQAHFAQIYSLYSRGEARQAFDKGMEVLKLLGVTFPSTPGKFRGACAWANCSWLLRGLSDDDIMILPVMENSRHLIVMRLLALTMTGANLAKPDFLPHLLTRMIHNTLKFGISDISKLWKI
jgi:predicted ATPase